jgi:hypothetical protein
VLAYLNAGAYLSPVAYRRWSPRRYRAGGRVIRRRVRKAAADS